MSSILTNTAAMSALQTLRATGRELSDLQNQISTGKKVFSARDNASVWSIFQTMKSDVIGFRQTNESLSFADAALGVGRNGAEKLSEIMLSIKSRITAASDGTADGATIQAEVAGMVEQANAIVNSSQFNGMNLLTKTTDSSFLSSLSRDSGGAVTTSNITVTAQGAAVTAALGALSAYDVSTTGGAATALASIDAQIDSVNGVAAALGASQSRVGIQSEFNRSLISAFETGIGSLIDADLEAASARIQAAQVQQQLGIQALSIANQQPQSILALFR